MLQPEIEEVNMELTYVHYLTLLGFGLPAMLAIAVENYKRFRLYYFLYIKKVSINHDRSMVETLFAYSGGVPGQFTVPSWLGDVYSLVYIHIIGPVILIFPLMFVCGIGGFFIGFGFDWFSR